MTCNVEKRKWLYSVMFTNYMPFSRKKLIFSARSKTNSRKAYRKGDPYEECLSRTQFIDSAFEN